MKMENSTYLTDQITKTKTIKDKSSSIKIFNMTQII